MWQDGKKYADMSLGIIIMQCFTLIFFIVTGILIWNELVQEYETYKAFFFVFDFLTFCMWAGEYEQQISFQSFCT